MEIITQIIQPLLPYIWHIVGGAVVAPPILFIAYRIFITKQTQHQVEACEKYRLAHLRRLGGNASDEDKELIKRGKPPAPTRSIKTSKPIKQYFSVDWHKAYILHKYGKLVDIKNDIVRFNPFNIIRELEESHSAIDQLKQSNSDLRSKISANVWTFEERVMKAIANDKKKKDQEAARNLIKPKRKKFESELDPSRKIGSSQFI